MSRPDMERASESEVALFLGALCVPPLFGQGGRRNRRSHEEFCASPAAAQAVVMPAGPGFAFITRGYVTHGPSRGHGVGRARRRDERRPGARCGIPEEIHHRLANTDVASAIGAPTMRLLRPMHIPARSLATRPARPSNPPTRTGWMPTAKIARLEEGRPQIGLLIAIERIAYDEVR